MNRLDRAMFRLDWLASDTAAGTGPLTPADARLIAEEIARLRRLDTVDGLAERGS
jgi:hypothetical protein